MAPKNLKKNIQCLKKTIKQLKRNLIILNKITNRNLVEILNQK
ncbi:unnamed protein product [Paramecium sonneborni]|uniref:Uncharacterized protein n=1 Tax=Paramecium sonneborni TaxID=65129 RepID=A0A8S1RLF9_9CILI|nr:unnamed protein product [Paramecium sonneborni]